MHWPSDDLYKEIHKVLSSENVQLTCQSYEESLKEAKEGDFVFLDPPYHKRFQKYSKNGFSEDDQVKLADLLKNLHQKGVKFMYFNYNTHLIMELFKEFEIIPVSTWTPFSKNQSNEILIKNY